MHISGANVLLTGATGGIGRALAQQLTDAGARLVVSSRSAKDLASLAAALGARPVPADLADLQQVTKLVGECGEVDVLVANAALPASGELLDYTQEQVDRALNVNLRAPVMLAHLLTPRMVAAGSGHLAFVGSMSGKAATRYSSLYTASKFGLRGFALSLRQDLHGTGVGVSLVQPGFVRDAGMFAATGTPVPSGVRTVSPDEVAGAVVRAVENDLCEVNIAPWKLRLQCALAVQFPGRVERTRRRGSDDAMARQIVEAQRPLR